MQVYFVIIPLCPPKDGSKSKFVSFLNKHQFKSQRQKRDIRLLNMNTDDINRILSRRVTEFDGVFSVDTLPEEPHLLVCNTDASHDPGRHWS